MKAIKRAVPPSQSSRDIAAGTSPVPALAGPVPRRQLEKTVSWTGRERLRLRWYRLRLTVQEMNCATRRTVELQAPWITDDRTR